MRPISLKITTTNACNLLIKAKAITRDWKQFSQFDQKDINYQRVKYSRCQRQGQSTKSLRLSKLEIVMKQSGTKSSAKNRHKCIILKDFNPKKEAGNERVPLFNACYPFFMSPSFRNIFSVAFKVDNPRNRISSVRFDLLAVLDLVRVNSSTSVVFSFGLVSSYFH
ncbi:hypothetical protein CEXT_116201 [Caerostris extrusa]|uniref:Uncharacterized protein n=1 Tax=Caerostris extrusa TaxID=172846 RepID=A0AAV4Y1K2_CAEEX|nr:hypothetical protein CEXT_116201 [Caerostris extrusa]